MTGVRPGQAPGGEAAPRGLHLADIRHAFPTPDGPLPVLDGITVTVAPGQFVAVIGPSGCGKSTLFDIVTGQLTPRAGTVTVIGGRPPGAAGPATPRGQVAHMPQRDLLLPWRTVLDNTALGLDVQGVPRREGRRRAAALFADFGLDGFERAYPDELSGGMRQRAALLRTMVQQRPIVALDEPLGALDSLTRSDLQVWLQRVWTEHPRTMLMITHDIREALLLADRVLVLSPRPARIVRDLTVDLPRPRDLRAVTTPEFVALEAELLDLLHHTTGGRPR
ncbi:ABC transporter ATP-binding protein [Nakamurella flava]|jgi:ABC-type nitrate/sulfonate/bicarbonate transport system ATPase subunit|uniref:ABC transporter ATP-binding protein n=1 Tax=Nakamurella flava TaxID=2576308 RepID=A0A4U6QLY9_9ACTN|nr:ABC transporter ATP-binding protein [Nakamurella flava]TKV61329.1 ABC transporter ATP-binding protein [Nakamurella flava]